MVRVKISGRGQLVIPGKLRRKYGIYPGAEAEWIDTGTGLFLIPRIEDPVESSRGMLRGTKVSTEALRKARAEDRALEEGKVRRSH
ncbi:hypothetical protein HKBW3S03_00974 [Candidatus Hakubella thermalkaliphila]|uniref:SpoVT-AbrB domain-containing protein n=2 Tax=Candidatus Hakubella thermalkaliphila TaxID=2754717 RepID=A0A6V8P798_9ACTN|nr:AbrB/MazE/SpoVT family DNA-binding domain-containing protein [Candidatus Hakubella thermalkaliphila]GFP19469.1 hypothetical protein HKBW3S03_00974 [Candidatus Hakubella thermalkaliphila]GFP23885.1 hypothetical protein HKBW3S09_01351 [Candidatus Hakubella thermalkaliphila]GFP24633.1 hypothetical protein HKBW3S25_00071 [Candidatus Hakubella thermalkaliphila]GFP27514.1 hypothetical protein HKBW3S33_00927 [Candidatus Hakubella thermalkaliphila]GFP30556.1 hypothetical protein HKBW3S34_01476 [Can